MKMRLSIVPQENPVNVIGRSAFSFRTSLSSTTEPSRVDSSWKGSSTFPEEENSLAIGVISPGLQGCRVQQQD
ncbi:hypothetical protein [Methanosarcina sp.]|uniref:hypothetical protein n=1 Tax=Methanosarcina sp. TaxID=2213 RepID=UPI003BB7C57E